MCECKKNCLTPDEVQNLRDDLASAERERAHQHGRADRSAAEHAREQAKREALQARVAELEGALKDAAASVKEWGAYASAYLQDKWDLSGEVARYIAIAEGKNAPRLEEKMSDIADELRAFEGSEALANGDFSVCCRGAAEIIRLRAALATALDNRPSEEIIREDRDAWPDHQANDPIRAAAKEKKP